MRKKKQHTEPTCGVITEKYTTLDRGIMDVYTITYNNEIASTILSFNQLKRISSFLSGFISAEEKKGGQA